jgi:protein TonB
LVNLDQRPEPRFRANPVYPERLRQSGVNGEVVVQFIVDASGGVRDVVAVRSTHRDFEEAAIQSLLKSKFSPGRKAGAAVSTRMQVKLEFTLNPGT